MTITTKIAAEVPKTLAGVKNDVVSFPIAVVRTDYRLVKDIQTELVEHGFNCGAADGLWGPRTQLAYNQFLSATGRSGLRDDYLTPQVAQILLSRPKTHNAPSRIPTAQKNDPKTLTEAQIDAAALAFEIEPAALKAVIDVECSGAGFLPCGQPKILVEAHWISYHTDPQDVFNKAFPTLSAPTWAEARKHYKGGKAEWDRFHRAESMSTTEISAVAAQSAYAARMGSSIGMGQGMGFNHRLFGYESVYEYWDAMHESEAVQLQGMLNFIKNQNLLRWLQVRDWPRFARGYNGEGFAVNKYDQKLADAYQRHL